MWEERKSKEELLSEDEIAELEAEAEETESEEPEAETEEMEAETGPEEPGSRRKSIYELLEEEIMGLAISDGEKARRLSRLIQVRGKKTNIMLVGSTGAGKSSTVNALFHMDVAKVGVGVDPETMSIDRYELDNFTIWDTPGLGDGAENDRRVTRDIIAKLSEADGDGLPLIDLVMVVLDASSKDLGTSYDLINHVLIPCLGEEAEKRILLALNQADVAMKGTHWDAAKNEPDEVLQEYLTRKAESVRSRIYEETGMDIRPVWYCAGFKEEGGEQRRPYNLTKLLYYIVRAIPREKRLALADHINEEKDNWLYDDHMEDYKDKVTDGFGDTVWFCISDGIEQGMEIGGDILGIPGKAVGAVAGAVVGMVRGLFSAIFG